MYSLFLIIWFLLIYLLVVDRFGVLAFPLHLGADGLLFFSMYQFLRALGGLGNDLRASVLFSSGS